MLRVTAVERTSRTASPERGNEHERQSALAGFLNYFNRSTRTLRSEADHPPAGPLGAIAAPRSICRPNRRTAPQQLTSEYLVETTS